MMLFILIKMGVKPSAIKLNSRTHSRKCRYIKKDVSQECPNRGNKLIIKWSWSYVTREIVRKAFC